MTKKKFGAFGAGQFSLGILVEGRPGTTIFQNPGGGGGGLGGVAYKDPARLPPPPPGILLHFCTKLALGPSPQMIQSFGSTV